MAEFTLHDHPARMKHAITGETVPMFPKQRSVRLGGKTIALMSEHGNLCFLFPVKILTEETMEECRAFVEREFMPVKNMASVPAEPQPEQDFDEDDD